MAPEEIIRSVQASELLMGIPWCRNALVLTQRRPHPRNTFSRETTYNCDQRVQQWKAYDEETHSEIDFQSGSPKHRSRDVRTIYQALCVQALRILEENQPGAGSSNEIR